MQLKCKKKTHNILFNLELLDYSSDVYGEILKRQSSYIFLPIMYGKKPIINVYKYIKLCFKK